MKIKESIVMGVLAIMLASNAAFADKMGILDTNADAIAARRDIISSAEKEILVEYFAVGRDEMTISLLNLLIKKASEGVKVKMIFDDFAKELSDDSLRGLVLSALDGLDSTEKHKVQGNIKIRIYNPQKDRIQFEHRDHAKMLIVDGKALVTGGRNFTSEYFGLDPVHNFIDQDVIVFGNTVKTARENFFILWDSELVASVSDRARHSLPPESVLQMTLDFCKPRESLHLKEKYASGSEQQGACINKIFKKMRVDEKSAKDSHKEDDTKYSSFFLAAQGDFDLFAPTYQTKNWEAEAVEVSDVQFFAQSPERFVSWKDKASHELTDIYLKKISQAKKEVKIVTPYFIPSKYLFGIFENLRKRGVRIQVFTNSAKTSDVAEVYAAYVNALDEVLSLGVEVHELQSNNETLHAKVTQIDGELSIVGTFNMDNRSSFYNREDAVFINEKDKTQNQRVLTSGIKNFIERIETKSVRINRVSDSEDATTKIRDIYFDLIQAILKVPYLQNKLEYLL